MTYCVSIWHLLFSIFRDDNASSWAMSWQPIRYYQTKIYPQIPHFRGFLDLLHIVVIIWKISLHTVKSHRQSYHQQSQCVFDEVFQTNCVPSFMCVEVYIWWFDSWRGRQDQCHCCITFRCCCHNEINDRAWEHHWPSLLVMKCFIVFSFNSACSLSANPIFLSSRTSSSQSTRGWISIGDHPKFKAHLRERSNWLCIQKNVSWLIVLNISRYRRGNFSKKETRENWYTCASELAITEYCHVALPRKASKAPGNSWIEEWCNNTMGWCRSRTYDVSTHNGFQAKNFLKFAF